MNLITRNPTLTLTARPLIAADEKQYLVKNVQSVPVPFDPVNEIQWILTSWSPAFWFRVFSITWIPRLNGVLVGQRLCWISHLQFDVEV